MPPDPPRRIVPRHDRLSSEKISHSCTAYLEILAKTVLPWEGGFVMSV